jgi:ribosomal protein S18 acetylase RimI-like enzyme
VESLLFDVRTLPADDKEMPLGPITRFVAESGGETLASGEITTTSFLGDGQIIGIRWSDDHVDAARAVLAATVEAARPAGEIHINSNPDVHDKIAERIALVESCGFELWREKDGYLWTDTGQDLPEPDRITLHSYSEVGAERFAEVFAATAPGLLDREMAADVERLGARAWATGFLADCEAADEPNLWLVADDLDGHTVGFVGLGEYEEGIGTLQHIGVVPDRRGRGYVDQLLMAAHRAARAHGYTSMFDGVDALNTPMDAAMERNGHHSAATPWHVTTHRRRA